MLNLTSYIEYQSMEKKIKIAHLEALNEIRGFWILIRSGLSGSHDLDNLVRLNSKIAKTVNRASSYYLGLLQKFPMSKNVLRLYGQFLSKC
jgi:hypothetical protein